MPTNFHLIMGVLAGAISFVAFVPYCVSIVRGKTHTARISWIIWTIAGIILGTSYLFSGAIETLGVAISYILGPMIVAILAFRYGFGGYNKFEIGCFAGSLLSLPIWWYFRSSEAALAINLFVDFLAVSVMCAKTFKSPHDEHFPFWILMVIASVFNLFAVREWTIPVASYAVYMLIGNSAILCCVCRKFLPKFSHT